MFVLCQRCSAARFLPLKQIQRLKVTGSFNFDLVSKHYNERYASKPPEFHGSVVSTNSSGRRFTMVLPPPNVTGVLHLGHALTVAIEDSIVRYHRLRGDERFIRAVRTAFIKLHRQKKIYEMNEQWYMDCTEANKAILAGLNAGIFFRWIPAEDKEEAAKFLETSVDMVVQSPDVLDTWFSSALIPLVVGGDWPRNPNPNFPVLDLMQTGHDIIGFWIARMWTICYRQLHTIFDLKTSGFSLTGEFPFTRVSLHGMIRDSQHRKMSKSLGNVIDPLHLINGVSLKEMIAVLKNSNLPEEEIESSVKATKAAYPHGIRRYGSDALRFAFFKRDLLSLDVSMNLIESVSEGYKFCNKLWNAIKYVDIAVQKKNEVCGPEHNTSGEMSDADKRIISELNKCVQLFDRHMADARPHLAFTAVFDFILLKFCDVYLETTKEAVWKADAQRLPVVTEILTSTASTALKCMSVFLPMICNYLLDETRALTNLQRIDFKNFDHSENDKLKSTEEESQTKESTDCLVERLKRCGFSDLDRNQLFTSLSAARRYVERLNLRPMLMLESEAMVEFDGVNTSDPNAVVVGLAPSKFDFHHMNQAFRLLLKNDCRLIAIHKARYYKQANELALGPGAYVEALEFATSKQSHIVGKPSTNFFNEALDQLKQETGVNLSPENTWMIGDDVKDDVLGAIRSKMNAILVKTGKYRKDDELQIPENKRVFVDNFADAVDFLIQKLEHQEDGN
ncbi:Valyl-tRNA synthetase [Aphelenchoides besseyi]|nr:Valyl-tRNA synthetase [Aphelenchoides besseyi]